VTSVYFLASFITGFLTACASPSPTPAPVITIGVINLSPQLEPVLDGFKTGLAALGYSNVKYIYDGPAPDIPGLDPIAERLVAANVDLILAISTPASQAAYRATLNNPVPIVFGPVTDPIAAKVVTNLNFPGGNITGVRLGLESEEQRLNLLVQLVPGVQRIFVPYNSTDQSANSSVMAAQRAAEELGVELILFEALDDDQITLAVESIPYDVQAIFLPQDSRVAARIDDFAAAAIARKLPLSTPTDGQVERGALISYSFRLTVLGEQQARLADQILQGTNPGDLPVEIAEFFLTLNLKTAEAIGLVIPDQVLRAADQIIR
jgi:putative tryptophan/tyrosine transport system substrate-binding protein